MKTLQTLVLSATLALLGWHRADAARLTLTSDSHLMLAGDSTLHPFESHTHQLQLTGSTSSRAVGEALWNDVLQSGGLPTLQLTIPVKSLKSKESGLDKNMYKAMNAEAYPEIIFGLSNYTVQPSTRAPAAREIHADGSLTIAGKQRPVSLTIDADPSSTVLRLKGRYTLQMSDYGIKPPKMMMGAIKVRDPVTISFELQMQAIAE